MDYNTVKPKLSRLETHDLMGIVYAFYCVDSFMEGEQMSRSDFEEIELWKANEADVDLRTSLLHEIKEYVEDIGDEEFILKTLNKFSPTFKLA